MWRTVIVADRRAIDSQCGGVSPWRFNQCGGDDVVDINMESEWSEEAESDAEDEGRRDGLGSVICRAERS